MAHESLSSVSLLPFDFGLSNEQENRAARLHRESIVFDWLSQHVGGAAIFDHLAPELRLEFDAMIRDSGGGIPAAAKAMYWPYELARQGRSQLIAEWYKESGMTCGTFGILVHDGKDPVALAFEEQSAVFDGLPWIRKVTTAEQVRKAKRDQIVALYGHCQPITPIPRELKYIDSAYERGLRSLMLTYNRMDHVGVGCTERVDAGLSMYGVDVVRHCNRLGIIVDTSHCGHLTTMDACRHSAKPVNANHTAAKSLADVARAKSDDAIRAIADTGGVIGVVAVPFFLTQQRHPPITAMLDHIDYIAGLVGWQHVSLGTDWPLQMPVSVQQAVLGKAFEDMGFRPEDRIDVTDRLRGFDDYRDLRNVTRGLVSRGYDDEQVQGIMGENAMRVFHAVCG